MLTCSKKSSNLLRKVGVFVSIISVFMLSLTACVGDNGKAKSSELVIGTTTPIDDSGLLDYLSPIIKEETGLSIKVISNDAEQTIKSGEAGEADVLLINDKNLEEKFVSDGYGLNRIELPSNYFVILGPANDPAGISSLKGSAAEAFKKIADSKSLFYSAEKDSIVNKKEMKLWQANNITPEGDWYSSKDKDLETVIYLANNENAYTLANRTTYSSVKDYIDLQIVMDTADDLNSKYTILTINPDKVKGVNKVAADQFVGWMTSQRAYKLIGEYVE
ncbi:substrate-binding domain-containing protein [Ruminiclostridium herbifermentans]|uniref:Substrate-binding domain-containing protein n=1 Tax=Ruminiclostridium herbifermentans TaxID=2488810 RepID=A0A4U7JB21_9FIRM|nr:substrate-binding domain-containing protein [Ruminiclostridium herbifermentans]QNU67903.1 substrate-binding domain-containing protein [Ruminiclostridium herbifermentans]